MSAGSAGGEAVRRLDRALCTMPEQARTVFLCHAQGLDLARIAQRMAIGLDEAETLLATAILVLDTAWEPPRT